MTWPRSTTTLGPLFTTPEMAEAFSDRARVAAMLEFEAALARSEARAGIIPQASASVIDEVCRSVTLDPEALGRAAMASGNLAIPLVKELTSRVAAQDGAAAGWVHWGATSQDVVDTGLVLQMRRAAALLDADLRRLADALGGLAAAHDDTVMAARTLMQQALPTSFGLKVAGWLSALRRAQARVAEAQARVQILQFGGAAGTLAALEDKGLAVAEFLAAELGLELPDLPWHSHRDRIADMGCGLGLLLGLLGKIGRDVALMAQTEVGELAEPAPGGSSTMPHKANPVGCARLIAAAQRGPGLVATLLAGMDQEHERGLGGWHAEWEVLPELWRLAGGAVRVAAEMIEGLVVRPDRMRANLGVTNGLPMAEAVAMALGREIGRNRAKEIVEAGVRRAASEGRSLENVLADDPAVTAHLSRERLAALFRPENYLGSAGALVTRVLDDR